MGDDLLNLIKSKKIIQGGMGLGVSNWRLARKVSSLGQLGVVSGVALEKLIPRKLQEGDTIIRDSILEFPDKEFAEEIVNKYFVPEGRPDKTIPYKPDLFPNLKIDENKNIKLKPNLEKLIILSTFAEVNLARKGHNNPIGINLLYEIEWPMIPALYGAMLAGVDTVLIGAGLPTTIPQVLDTLSKNEHTTMTAKVNNGKDYRYFFNPENTLDNLPELKRPPFLAIINGHLAARGVRHADGYVVEGPTAGGHNPPARGKQLNELGEPLFGKKDDLDLKAFQDFLKNNSKEREKEIQPFWLAGEYANQLGGALWDGAQGVQVGTPFAFSHESGIPIYEKQKIIEKIVNEGVYVYTDPRASPSGFPFKVMQVENSLSESQVYETRKRICNIGHLIDLVENENGKIITRCPAEPLEHYLRKGGKLEDTVGRKCLCNGLSATVGYGNPNEPAIYTSGKNHQSVKDLVKIHGINYSAKDVIDYILNS